MKLGGQMLIPMYTVAKNSNGKTNIRRIGFCSPKCSQKQHDLLSMEASRAFSYGKATSVLRSPLKENYINMWEQHVIYTPLLKELPEEVGNRAPKTEAI